MKSKGPKRVLVETLNSNPQPGISLCMWGLGDVSCLAAIVMCGLLALGVGRAALLLDLFFFFLRLIYSF